ncbi:hypothetical protein FRC18_007714 [Serendipita sp. 400]|nr:hypothetical protein FRC18_007714 [Serendipita sp. 400]
MSSLKISLPPHLREALEPLTDVLPPELSAIVIEALNSTEIKYDTLADVSRWAFTEDGENSLKKKSLNQRDYDRVSLLAGTITGPSKLLPPPEPKPEPWEIAQDEKNTRRAIAALVNGLFSVVGIGAAVWWASKTTGWTDETRIGLSILGGLVAAIAEGGLFAIYYNRREQAKDYRAKRRDKEKKRLEARHLKRLQGDITAAPESDIPPMSNADSKEVDSGPIRRRVVTVDGGGDELVAAGKRGDDE